MKNRSTIQTLTFVQINPEHLYMKLNMKLVHAIIHSFGLKKLAPCKNVSWLLTFKTGTNPENVQLKKNEFDESYSINYEE
jgi:hypothetical protein